MNTKVAAVACILGIALLGGCAGSRSFTTAPSMGLMRPERTVVTLGAGDSLGCRVYFNDLVIAARDHSGDFAVTSVPETAPVLLGE